MVLIGSEKEQSADKAIKIDVSKFKEDSQLNPGTLLISIKNKDGAQLRAALASSGASGKSWGRDIRKDPHAENGALMVIDCKPKKTSWEIVNNDLYGPRGILVDNDKIFVATTGGVVQLTKQFKQNGVLTDPFCNWMHAVVSPNAPTESNLLIASSSRLGTILTFNKDSGELVNRWHGWEHGFDTSLDGTIVTGNPQIARELEKIGKQVILIDKENPEASLDELTTPKQAFRCTGLSMEKDNLIGSLFTGEVIELPEFSMNGEKAEPKVLTSGHTNLHTPGYIAVSGSKSLWAADTMEGKVIQISETGTTGTVIDFSNQMYANMGSVNNSEKIWLQGFKEMNNIHVALDGTTNMLIVVDFNNNSKRIIDLPDKNWAVHDFVAI